MVTNIINGNIYIGKTVRTLNKRKCEHIYSSNKGSNSYLHRAIRKYGIEYFEWEEICTAENKDELIKKEISFIRHYKNAGFHLYNMTDGGEGTSGYKLTEATKQKISKANKGKVRNIGKVVSISTRNKLSEAHCGKILSEEHKHKISESLKGNTRKKGKKCGPFTEEHKHKISESQKGKFISEETRRKMSESAKIRCLRQKDSNCG